MTWFILSVVGIVAKNTPSDKVTKYSYSDYTKYSDYLARIIYDDFMSKDFAIFLCIFYFLDALQKRES